ncbi:terminase small subunit [Lacticaseibacillus paracasei]|uniref:Terminase small subunit n=1 Tax=Lacticaseibacillus paracasei TaxID=1597 RepID=A0AAP4N577_LACPA|nr:terminase small subunit [Lacticaseibacillus paracasei]MDM7455471.1 terminase small subunit [Lacticaseibacillus paracasei]MDM7472160.1 terminase small subunit [Lacticaseibacillus paracasei]
MRLTAKQKKFVDSYIADSNATKAALEAGYSKRTARFVGAENLTKPNIKAAIDERMKHIESDKIAKAAEVLQYFTTVLRGEAKETIIVSTPDGADAVENDPSIKDRMAAGKELLKRYPGDDEMFKAQLDKLQAEADILKAKAKRETGEDTSNITINIKPIQQDGGDDSAD